MYVWGGSEVVVPRALDWLQDEVGSFDLLYPGYEENAIVNEDGEVAYLYHGMYLYLFLAMRELCLTTS